VVVGDDDDAGVLFVGDLAKSSMTWRPRWLVERGGGFVGEDEAGLVGEGAGDGDALLLAAGEGVGQVVGACRRRVVEQLHGAARASRGGVSLISRAIWTFSSAVRNGMRLAF
jgi:hypothetical protein